MDLVIEARTIDKSSWGEGPWQDEPDAIAWVETKASLYCMILRSGVSGSLCGYAAVTKGHPFFGVHYDHRHVAELQAHGGLTFCGRYAERGGTGFPWPKAWTPLEKLWWFGFDTAHWNDYMPAIEAILRRKTIPYMYEGFGLAGQYRTVAYVEAEVVSLAIQLAVNGKRTVVERDVRLFLEKVRKRVRGEAGAPHAPNDKRRRR